MMSKVHSFPYRGMQAGNGYSRREATTGRAVGQGEGILGDPVKTWRGRRVFLTGHTGFKGSWLALWLSSLGAKIRGYALDPSTEPNMFTLACVGSVVEDVRGDVRDYAELQASITEFAPEVVFHLAAQPIVRRSYADPLGTYGTNVMGTVHVLEAIRQTPSVRAVVCVTTDKCYQNQEWIWPYRETDPLGGYDPYASSKACAEIVSAAYRSSFFPPDQLHEQHGVALATVRAGNVIGGGDWSEDRLIPDMVRGFVSGQPVLIRARTCAWLPDAGPGTPGPECTVRFLLQLWTERRRCMASRAHCDQASAHVGQRCVLDSRLGSQRARGSCSKAGLQ